MEITGYILIVLIIAGLWWYFRWSRTEATAEKSEAGQIVTVLVEGAYNPNTIRAKKGEKITIIFDRKEDSPCSKEVIFSDFGITAKLTDFGKTPVVILPDRTGEFVFTCGMGMYQGKLIVED